MPHSPAPADETGTDQGFTLIELLIASLLLVVVLAIVGAMLASLQTASRRVDALSATSSSAQVAAESIERGIRNSSDFLLSTPSGTDQLLIARTAQGGSTLTWICAAWYFSAANGGSIRYTQSPSAIAAPSSSALATWTLLASNVSPLSGSAVFGGTSPQLTIGFSGQSSSGGSVSISSTVLSRAGSAGSPACY
ncbi:MULTISPECIES: prepilin-type N-terminal cleavage/methylation domain-containing protein [unclassified Leifsonia]|uniref:prepilin-type N-terminal cleavage/methylation domain-containing protein n=1 Tax=unclassified Leifsonia TaxID=2663824 RepID=UPI0008A7AAF2|nr:MULTISPECIES: prepilin-type N-terminal cleavage/methylation domain-containing protein [unclassified Leifsonia]SEH68148.1 prepilin-type N-terminal cleavage/methylation domain-containing protein [Leifsonia sp. CL154]SFL29639.1 prepilin-type N-terminal cleavage/methylation domain-containing protein [Leifsonia sp. CL147]